MSADKEGRTIAGLASEARADAEQADTNEAGTYYRAKWAGLSFLAIVEHAAAAGDDKELVNLCRRLAGLP